MTPWNIKFGLGSIRGRRRRRFAFASRRRRRCVGRRLSWPPACPPRRPPSRPRPPPGARRPFLFPLVVTRGASFPSPSSASSCCRRFPLDRPSSSSRRARLQRFGLFSAPRRCTSPPMSTFHKIQPSTRRTSPYVPHFNTVILGGRSSFRDTLSLPAPAHPCYCSRRRRKICPRSPLRQKQLQRSLQPYDRRYARHFDALFCVSSLHPVLSSRFPQRPIIATSSLMANATT